MYEQYLDRMIDRVNPFETARPAPFPDRNMRAFIAPIFSAMAMDHHGELISAWKAIIEHPAYPDTIAIVTANDVQDSELAIMLAKFDALPSFSTASHNQLDMDSPEERKILKHGWLRDQWAGDSLWHPEDRGGAAFRRIAADYFRNQYRQILEQISG
jgi:hypothetical protein